MLHNFRIQLDKPDILPEIINIAPNLETRVKAIEIFSKQLKAFNGIDEISNELQFIQTLELNIFEAIEILQEMEKSSNISLKNFFQTLAKFSLVHPEYNYIIYKDEYLENLVKISAFINGLLLATYNFQGDKAQKEAVKNSVSLIIENYLDQHFEKNIFIPFNTAYLISRIFPNKSFNITYEYLKEKSLDIKILYFPSMLGFYLGLRLESMRNEFKKNLNAIYEFCRTPLYDNNHYSRKMFCITTLLDNAKFSKVLNKIRKFLEGNFKVKYQEKYANYTFDVISNNIFEIITLSRMENEEISTLITLFDSKIKDQEKFLNITTSLERKNLNNDYPLLSFMHKDIQEYCNCYFQNKRSFRSSNESINLTSSIDSQLTSIK
ncbi:MAG: hypothetical protein J0H68_08935 [Sphingobacteriia bacterium]|nr:hypothetical protein [Sphingobacteriia bacterium]